MKTVKVKVSPPTSKSGTVGRIDTARVDATTESEIQAQIAEDEKEAMLDAAKFARRVRDCALKATRAPPKSANDQTVVTRAYPLTRAHSSPQSRADKYDPVSALEMQMETSWVVATCSAVPAS